MAEVWLRRSRKKRLESGHPWVYRNEIEDLRGDPQTGAVVRVKNHQGFYLATGFYHAESQIAVRIVSYDEREKIDSTWLRRTVGAAWSYRKRFLADVESCRAVYGEADGVPGLIVDKYGAVAVVQILSAAMDGHRDWIVSTLREVLGVTAIYERSDAPVRALEGLEERTGSLYGDCPKLVEIREHGLRMLVDIVEGQKTGHFFDQRDNRAAIAPVVRWGANERPRPDQRFRDTAPDVQANTPNSDRKGADVLDCFTHTGSFALHALHYGAAHVTALDASDTALAQAQANMERNGFGEERCTYLLGNAFDVLREMEKEKSNFDVVILDPPAFAKSKGAVVGALRGYKEIHLRALKLIRDGGFLVTASCSSHVTPALWREVIAEAAFDTRKRLRLVEFRSAGKDHPQLVGMAENDYLKFAIYAVNNR